MPCVSGERCPAASVDRWFWVKSIMGSYMRVCCGYVTCAQHGCGNGREHDMEGVGARVWPECRLRVRVLSSQWHRVSVSVTCKPCPPGCYLWGCLGREEVRSSPPPNGVLRIGSSLCVCVCVCSHRRVSWPWAPTEVALSPKLIPLACPFVLLSVCARLARRPYPQKL